MSTPCQRPPDDEDLWGWGGGAFIKSLVRLCPGAAWNRTGDPAGMGAVIL